MIKIGFEGCSCVGKTTLLDHIFHEKGIPYAPEINQIPQDLTDPFEIQEWFFRATLYNLRRNSKGLDSSTGELLLFDRTFFSSLAYTIALDVLNRRRFLPRLLEKYQPEIDDPSNYQDYIFVLTEDPNIITARITEKFANHGEWSNPQFINEFNKHLLKMIGESGKKFEIITSSNFEINRLRTIAPNPYLRDRFSASIGEYYRTVTA